MVLIYSLLVIPYSLWAEQSSGQKSSGAVADADASASALAALPMPLAPLLLLDPAAGAGGEASGAHAMGINVSDDQADAAGNADPDGTAEAPCRTGGASKDGSTSGQRTNNNRQSIGNQYN